jgi:predicted lipoprotein with Yx(FWY)xxD motif
MNAFAGRPQLLTLFAIAIAIGLAACGSSDESTGSTTASAGGGDTVSVSSVSGTGEVLVDSGGNALYTSDEEAGGKVACRGSCESVWLPLTVSGSSQPTAPDDVSGKLGTLRRPGGGEQVTFGGAPLYTFADDGGPGQVTGDGLSDEFGGMSFTWHVVRVGGSDATAPETTTTTGSGGGYSAY